MEKNNNNKKNQTKTFDSLRGTEDVIKDHEIERSGVEYPGGSNDSLKAENKSYLRSRERSIKTKELLEICNISSIEEGSK